MTRSDITDADWDSELLALGGHFLQSTPWQQVQRALGYDALRDRSEGWMWSAAVRAGRFPRYLYIPYGPAARAGQEAGALRSVVHAAATRSVDFARLEPGESARAALQREGAVLTRSIQPAYTSILDVTQDEATLRAGLSAGHRGSINAAERRVLTIRAARDAAAIESFLEVRGRGKRPGFEGQSDRYHRTVAAVLAPLDVFAVYSAHADGDVVAAAVCFDFGTTRYYAHAASDAGRGRRLGAAAPLVWRMLLDARDRGMARFDFWGVAPPGATDHAWAGLSQFKLAFGGGVTALGGTWDIPVRRVRHRLYRLAASTRR